MESNKNDNKYIIKINNAMYEFILKRIEEIMDAEPETLEFYELDLLSDIVEQYEDKEFSF